MKEYIFTLSGVIIGVLFAILLAFVLGFNGCGLPQPRNATLCYKETIGWVKCPNGIKAGTDITDLKTTKELK